MEAVPTPPSYFDNKEERQQYATVINACWKAAWKEQFELDTKEMLTDKVVEKLRLEGFVVGKPNKVRTKTYTNISWRK